MSATTAQPLSRFCFALDIADSPDSIERYKWWHRPGGPPEAVTRSLLAADIRELEIWHCGSRLFMVLEAGPDYDPAAKAAAVRRIRTSLPGSGSCGSFRTRCRGRLVGRSGSPRSGSMPCRSSLR